MTPSALWGKGVRWYDPFAASQSHSSHGETEARRRVPASRLHAASEELAACFLLLVTTAALASSLRRSRLPGFPLGNVCLNSCSWEFIIAAGLSAVEGSA